MTPENETPEFESYEVSLDQIEAARNEMAKRMLSTAHNWRQSGTQVSCTSCPFGHGFAVPPGQFLVSIDEAGKPVFKELWKSDI